MVRNTYKNVVFLRQDSKGILHDSILIFPHAKNERCEKGGEIPNAKLLKLNHKESEVIMDHVLYTVFL